MKDASKEANKAEFEPVFEKVSAMNKHNKVQLVHTLIKELNLGNLDQPQERRRDPTQRGGSAYSKSEFIAFYGPKEGTKMWNLSGKKVSKRRGDRVCSFLFVDFIQPEPVGRVFNFPFFFLLITSKLINRTQKLRVTKRVFS